MKQVFKAVALLALGTEGCGGTVPVAVAKAPVAETVEVKAVAVVIPALAKAPVAETPAQKAAEPAPVAIPVPDNCPKLPLGPVKNNVQEIDCFEVAEVKTAIKDFLGEDGRLSGVPECAAKATSYHRLNEGKLFLQGEFKKADEVRTARITCLPVPGTCQTECKVDEKTTAPIDHSSQDKPGRKPSKGIKCPPGLDIPQCR